MKHIFSSLCLGVMALGLASSTPVQAAAQATPIPVKRTVIASISADSITIDTRKTVTVAAATTGPAAKPVDAASSTKTYTINKETKITFEGKPSTVEELKEGMRVNVTQGFDPSIAAVIAAADAPKPAVTPKPPLAPKKIDSSKKAATAKKTPASMVK